jgi:hypothetical protein
MFIVDLTDEPPHYTIDGRAVSPDEWARRVELAGPASFIVQLEYADDPPVAA